MLATLAIVVAAAVAPASTARPAAADAVHDGGSHIDVGSILAGPLAPSVAHLDPGQPGGTDVTLYNVNTRETLTAFVRFDGLTDDATAASLSRFLRCKRTGRQRKIHPGTLAVFSQVVAHYPGKVIEVVSGVRAPGFGVRDSKHYSGHAIDFRVRGVKTRAVRDLVWSFDEQIGVGHYTGEDFIHLDERAGEGKIAWEQRRPGQANRYNPKWAKQADTAGATGDDAHAEAAPARRAPKPRPARVLRSKLPTS